MLLACSPRNILLTRSKGLSVVVNVSLVTGSTCYVLPKWDIEQACELIQKHRISFLYVPPPIVLALGKHPAVDKYDLSSVRWINSGAAPLGKELVTSVWDRLQVGVKQGYGLSETSPTTHTQLVDEWSRFQGSVGKLLPNMQVKIIDPEGKEMPAGEVRYSPSVPIPFVRLAKSGCPRQARFS